MATVRSNYQPGDIVYMPYTPQRPGKVLAVKMDTGFKKLTIRWLTGPGDRTSHEWATSVRDFHALVADHRKKILTLTDLEQRANREL